ncbi:MAG: hypothetical protein U5O39_14265 [Gammaproteobacteria bacterium]|nr:hypothetical protein [Gammaproteobacteria bacterium]
MTRHRAKAGDVLLDLLRGAGAEARTAAYLIENGELFGFTENTVRVTLSRLQSRGVIESPARGCYRLAQTADPVNEFVERWRLGEHRVRPWNGRDWLFVHTTDESGRSRWAMEAAGLRQVRSKLFVRPDNLNLSLEALEDLLERIGLEKSALFIAGEPAGDSASGWMKLWPCDMLSAEYRTMADRLAASLERLPSLDTETARIETFRVGGEGIHLLAKDPLLPAPFVDIEARRRLWSTMCEYDARGREIWAVSRRDKDSSLPIPRLANAE